MCGSVRVWGCEELGCVLLGEVCVMGICGESRNVYVVFSLECRGRRRGCGGWADVAVLGGEWGWGGLRGLD